MARSAGRGTDGPSLAVSIHYWLCLRWAASQAGSADSAVPAPLAGGSGVRLAQCAALPLPRRPQPLGSECGPWGSRPGQERPVCGCPCRGAWGRGWCGSSQGSLDPPGACRCTGGAHRDPGTPLRAEGPGHSQLLGVSGSRSTEPREGLGPADPTGWQKLVPGACLLRPRPSSGLQTQPLMGAPQALGATPPAQHFSHGPGCWLNLSLSPGFKFPSAKWGWGSPSPSMPRQLTVPRPLLPMASVRGDCVLLGPHQGRIEDTLGQGTPPHQTGPGQALAWGLGESRRKARLHGLSARSPCSQDLGFLRLQGVVACRPGR